MRESGVAGSLVWEEAEYGRQPGVGIYYKFKHLHLSKLMDAGGVRIGLFAVSGL